MNSATRTMFQIDLQDILLIFRRICLGNGLHIDSKRGDCLISCFGMYGGEVVSGTAGGMSAFGGGTITDESFCIPHDHVFRCKDSFACGHRDCRAMRPSSREVSSRTKVGFPTEDEKMGETEKPAACSTCSPE